MFDPPPDPRPQDRPWPALVWPDPAHRLRHDRLVLTRTTPDDAAELFAALADPVVWVHVATPPQSPREWRDTIAAAPGSGRHMWTVRLASGEVVGTTSYLDVSAADARLEIGWTLYRRDTWGGHVNPAAKLLLLGHAFDDLLAGRVQLKTDVRNHRSQRAIARLGATHEGTLRRYQRRRDGSVRDTVLFSVTADDWPRVRAGLLARLAE